MIPAQNPDGLGQLARHRLREINHFAQKGNRVPFRYNARLDTIVVQNSVLLAPSKPLLLFDHIHAVKFLVGFRQVDDALNQSDDPHGNGAVAARQHGNEQHDDGRRGKTEDELVNAQRAQQDPADPGRDLVSVGRHRRRCGRGGRRLDQMHDFGKRPPRFALGLAIHRPGGDAARAPQGPELSHGKWPFGVFAFKNIVAHNIISSKKPAACQ